MHREEKRFVFDTLILVGSVLLVSAAIVTDALADGRRVPLDPAYKAECGSCHVAYPAKRLPAQSWRDVMQGLPKHFGADASVDGATSATILAYLEKNAGRRSPPPDARAPRITETAWFGREHRKVPAATWTSPQVKSRANCAACHTQAEEGDYRESNIRLPR